MHDIFINNIWRVEVHIVTFLQTRVLTTVFARVCAFLQTFSFTYCFNMIQRITILFTFLVMSISTLQAQCDTTAYDILRLELQPDEYFQEISWRVSSVDGNTTFGMGSCANPQFLTAEYCIPKNVCTQFRMNDSYGDGVAPGNYKLFLNDSLIFENPTGVFGYYQIFQFSCAPGYSCNSAIDINEGSHTTIDGGEQTWYSFTPAQNGIYKVSTCDSTNLCGTKIWVYEGTCQDITVTNNNLGTTFYSEGGCANNDQLAEASLFLGGGVPVLIRIGYASGNCNQVPIQFTLSFDGFITGCTDSTACNYNPLATISGDCYPFGSPECPNAPDLIVLKEPLVNTIKLGSIQNNNACYIEEGCLRGFGQRTLIEFTTHIQNIGEEDYFIGQPPSNPNTPSDQFVWDPCHNHWHYLGYAEYVLFDEDGNKVPIGSKTGFCVLDLECDNGGQGKYSCNNMGITAGCGDIYDIGLPCQWIDITDMPAGHYTFVLRVNWDQSPDKLGRVEKNYENNWVQTCFILNYLPDGSPDVEFIGDCAPVVDCLGEPYGDAQIDCEGVCDGTALKGDWDKNIVRDMVDVDTYLTAALTDTSSITTCRDLFEDNHLDVYDAAVLQECILYQNDPGHWGTRFPCEFPTGSTNPGEFARFSVGSVDTSLKTIDIRIQNPSNKMLGFELEFSGLVIDSVVNLMPDFDAVYAFNNKRVVALSRNEMPVKKNITPNPVFRIYYNYALSDSTFCLDSVIAAVNEQYLKATVSILGQNCKTLKADLTNDIQEPLAGTLHMLLLPNPANDMTTLYYNNPNNLLSDIEMLDMQGRRIRYYPNIRDNEVPIHRNNLPSGMYQIKIRNAEGVGTAKIFWK